MRSGCMKEMGAQRDRRRMPGAAGKITHGDAVLPDVDSANGLSVIGSLIPVMVPHLNLP